MSNPAPFSATPTPPSTGEPHGRETNLARDVYSRERSRKTPSFSGTGMFLASLAIHAVLIALAARWIVQSISAERSLNFKAGPAAGSGAPAARKHQVRMPSGTPPTPVASPLPNAFAIPNKPALSLPPSSLPATSLASPGGLRSELRGISTAAPNLKKISPLPGAASGIAPLASLGAWSGSAGNFGVKPAQGTGAGLTGTLYYMRRQKDGKEIPAYSPEDYLARMVALLGEGGKIKDSEASQYLRVAQQLTSYVILFPPISGEIAPAAFGAQQVPDHRQCWFVTYQAKISAPTANRYRFVGGGNEVLIVRVDGKVALDGSWGFQWPQKGQNPTGHAPREKMPAIYGDKRAVGDWVRFSPGGSQVEIIIGAGWRGAFGADLCVEEEGQNYSDQVRPLFKVEGFQKMQPQIDAAFKLPEAASSFSIEGPTFKVR